MALTGDAIRSGSAYQTIAAAISTQAMTLTSSAMFGSRLRDEIADFSVGDWQAEADLIYENTVDPADRALGPIEWWVSPPQFIWQSAASLTAGWRSYGEPMIGQAWYGTWSHCRMPDFASFDHGVSDACPLMALLVGELHLRERVVMHLGSFPEDPADHDLALGSISDSIRRPVRRGHLAPPRPAVPASRGPSRSI